MHSTRTKRATECTGEWIGPDRLGCKPEAVKEREQSVMTSAELLPFHLISCRLPLRQLLQLRCVCKLWNSMLGGAALASGGFWNAGTEEYWFVMPEGLPRGQKTWNFRYTFSSQDWAYFKTPLPSHRHAALANLLGGMGCRLLPRLKYTPKGRCTPQLVSAGGLMCAIVHRPDASDVYPVIVCDRLTGSVKVLPPLINPGFLSTSPSYCRMYMAIDEDDPAWYYIMLSRNGLGLCGREEFYSEVFDSRRGYWRVEDNIDSVAENSKVSHADFFFYVEYFINKTAALLAYHTSDNAWSKVSVPPRVFDEFGFRFTFLKYKGRLLQGIDWRAPGVICRGFVVWELKLTFNEVAKWVEVARTPEHFLEGVSTMYWSPKLKAEGSLFYMVFEDDHVAGLYLPPLVYDIAQNLWYFVPVPMQRGFKRFGCICGHRPRLSLRVPHLEGEEQI